jgi:hypothetical protein
LERLVTETRVGVLCTRASLMRGGGGGAGGGGRAYGGNSGNHYLGEQWAKLVSWRVHCSRGGAYGNEYISQGVGTGSGGYIAGATGAPASFTINDGGIVLSTKS